MFRTQNQRHNLEVALTQNAILRCIEGKTSRRSENAFVTNQMSKSWLCIPRGKKISATMSGLCILSRAFSVLPSLDVFLDVSTNLIAISAANTQFHPIHSTSLLAYIYNCTHLGRHQTAEPTMTRNEITIQLPELVNLAREHTTSSQDKSSLDKAASRIKKSLDNLLELTSFHLAELYADTNHGRSESGHDATSSSKNAKGERANSTPTKSLQTLANKSADVRASLFRVRRQSRLEMGIGTIQSCLGRWDLTGLENRSSTEHLGHELLLLRVS